MFPEVAKYHQQYSYRSIWNCDTTKDIISQFLHHIEEPILFFYIEQLFNLKALKYSHMELPIFLNQGIKRSFIAILEVRSLNIDCLFTNDGEIRFYPKGDSVLDKILVEDVIPLTTNNSEKLYKDALTSYFKKDFNIAADNLRKCLESWIKNELKMTGSNLENIAKGELKKALNMVIGNNHSAHNGFIDHFCQLVSTYYMRIHNDGDIKHPEKDTRLLSEAEFEFILYQTGAIIRFLDKVQISKYND